MTATADFGASLLTTLARLAGIALLALGVALALTFAFVAALVVGLMILGAAIAMRFAPRRADTGEAGFLEARRTPAGWVVETAAKAKS